jgi:hypothetical protein
LYSQTYLYSDGSSRGGSRSTGTGYVEAGYIATSSSSNTTPSTVKISINNYANSTTAKTIQGKTTNSVQYAAIHSGLWRASGNAAINSITVKLGRAGASFVAGTTISLYGIKSGAPQALGGDIVATDGTYWYHAFKSTGTFTPLKTLSADVIVVAGGGAGASVGGSAETGGGGGAGGFRLLTSQSLPAASYTVTVGAGGSVGSSGTNSSMNSISATGGGYGGGGSGGSGGGGLSQNGAQRFGGAGNAGSYSPVEGYAGGNGNSSSNSYAGGGGGAGAAGANGTGGQSGAGGIGAGGVSYANYATINAMALATGTGVLSSGNYYFAGGGGGGSASGVSAGSGGTGGGGAGETAGTINTGGGAGGGSPSSGSSRAGGSGIVIIRYTIA